MSISRRLVLQTLAAGAATALLPRRGSASKRREAPADAKAILYDSSRCIGCRECVRGCSEANGWDCTPALGNAPALTQTAPTVLQRFFTADGHDCFRKVQCMHCVDPACVSACMLGAMHKDADGAVVWDGDLCVGCRYCQIACPYTVPRFEWDTPLPELNKCQLCPERRAQGLAPACVEQCRRGALEYGTRQEMLAEAHRRLEAQPDRYNPKVFGEHDGGGTAWLYLAPAEVSFAQLGLPDLGERSVPELPESIQHTVYKGFAAPLALFALLGAVVRRNSRKLHEEEAAHHATEKSEPVGGKLVTPTTVTLAGLALLGVVTVLWRFFVGLGAATNLNDGYPMGLWIVMDVVTGTALACGGYAMALMVYVANRGRYHPLVRPALLTSAFGYTLGGVSVLVDIGRFWNFYRIPTHFWAWNLNSILLEVALCIMLYTTVLWIEVSPAILEGWQESRIPSLRRLSHTVLPRLEKALPYFIALGLLLPTMHQSSLGSMMLLAGQKLHPLWHTPFLPLLFLISVVGMGYAAVVLECYISAKAFKRPQETPMLRALALPIALVLLTYAALRVTEIVRVGEWGLVTRMDGYSLLFLLEIALFLVPALALLLRRKVAGPRFLVGMAGLVVAGGGLYRFSTFLFAFDPGDGWSYFPSLAEFAVTVGFISAEILGYIVMVKLFPFLRGTGSEHGHGDSLPSTADDTPAAESPLPPRWAETPVMARSSAGFATGGLVRLLATAAAVGILGASLVARPPTAGAVSALAQTADTVPGEDLRCLTRRPGDCLDAPVSRNEPHGAVCATCHDLWDPTVPATVTRSCTDAGCHSESLGLTGFHRTVEPSALTDCLHCHTAHDFRVPESGAACSACHRNGGSPVAWVDASSTHRLGGPAVFTHAAHEAVTCGRCHGSGTEHGTLTVITLEECRSCHHQSAVASSCEACHAPASLAGRRIMVTRSLDIRVGSLDRPLRLLPFDHGSHLDIACVNCHTKGTALRAAAGADCSSCHVQHHEADSDCSLCHETPRAGAHDAGAHLGCGGAGCHDPAPEAIRWAPRTRELCLACHTDRTDHKPERTCADCHRLPTAGPV